MDNTVWLVWRSSERGIEQLWGVFRTRAEAHAWAMSENSALPNVFEWFIEEWEIGSRTGGEFVQVG